MKTIYFVQKGNQAGFTIIETLIALLIMSFGMLALAGMQISLSRNADESKQRTEATYLAQQKIEELRSYTGIASTVVGQGTTSIGSLNWNALSGSVGTSTSNVTYTRTWTLGADADEPMRGLSSVVSWLNRAGQTQTVALSTILAKSDPADSGFLGYPLPLNTNLKRPKNRNLDIPIRAIDLGNGQSATKFGASGQYILFNNLSGDIEKVCTPILASTSDAAIISALTSNSITSNCNEKAGFIVAGYISKGPTISMTDWNLVNNALRINSSNILRNAAGGTGIECTVGDAEDQNTGVIIPNFKYYICVIPLAVPTTALTNKGPYNWSGTIRIAGPAIWNLLGSKYFVCRYQYAQSSSLNDSNLRNVQPYSLVDKSIDQQNYLIDTTSNNTSTTPPSCPSVMTVTDVSVGVLHQDCRSASNLLNYATACSLN